MALTTKEKALYILGAVAILVGLGFLWYFLSGDDECDPNNNGYTVKGKPSDKCKVNDPNIINAVPPTGCTWVPDTTFPIKRCSWGTKVKAVQKALGFSIIDQDGRYGDMTEGAVKKKLGKAEISNQADYEKIVGAPKPPPSGGTNYDQLKTNLAGKSTAFENGIYTPVSGKNKKYIFWFYVNGRFFVTEADKQTNILKGSYADGGTEMYIDGGSSYGNILSKTVTQNMNSIISDIE